MRKASLLFSLLCLVGFAAAQEPIAGTMEVAFGWVKQPDGTRKSIKGLKFPYSATPIEAQRISPVGLRAPSPSLPGLTPDPLPAAKRAMGLGGGAMFAEQTIYSAWDGTGNGYAILDPVAWSDPSSLDDVFIDGAGSGKVWTKMRFAAHCEGSPHMILIRWRIWNTHVSNPPGTNDFVQEIADFGTLFTPNAGTWGYETSGSTLQQAAISVGDLDCYVAQQFRDTSDLINGNGPFETDMYNVYYIAAPPSIGSSPDGWFFDHEPLNGIYEDSEFDRLSETTPPPYSNMAFQFLVNNNSQTSTLLPQTATQKIGRYVSGDAFSMWFDNDSDTYIAQGAGSGLGQPPMTRVEIQTTSPTSSPTSLRVQVRAKVNKANCDQKIEIWRYTGTPGWVTLETKHMPVNSFSTSDVLYGGAIPLSQFLNAQKKMLMRITHNSRSVLGQNIQSDIDRANWLITY